MFTSVERWIAWRYLKSRRQEGFISVIAWFSLIGIALGVATLIIVMSVMNGFRQELLGRIMGLNGHVVVRAVAGDGIGNFDDLVSRLKSIPEVQLVTPSIEGQVMATAKGTARGAVVRGIRAEDLARRQILSDNIVAGSLDEFQGDNAILVGARLAERMNVWLGDDITLISPEGRTTVVGTIPRARSYKIVALFDVGMFEYDSTLVFMPLQQAQTYFRLRDQINEVELFIGDPDRAGAIALVAREEVGSQGYVYSWQQAHAQFFNALQVERNVMFLILTLIILVAAFNIISSQIMMVHDKAKGIAILRTMGATRGTIQRVFLMTGASVGIVGTLLGFLLGLGFTDNIDSIRLWLESLSGTELWSAEIRFLSQIPAIIDPDEVVMVVLMGIGLSFLATIYPAWRAAKMDPVEALRYA